MKDSDTNENEGAVNVLKLILPYFFVVGSFQLIAYNYLGLDLSKYKIIDLTPTESLILMFVTLIATATVLWLMLKFVDEKPFHDLGFKNTFLVQDSLKGISLGFIIMLLGFVLLLFGNQIEIKNSNFDFYSFVSSIFLFLFVAISEEILLRGYILKNLMASFNNSIALIISAIIFSLLHAGNPNISAFSLFQLFIAGILLGIPYILTKNLWFSIGLHFSWNFFQGTIFGFNVSGQDHYSIIETEYTSANLWNGGSFGFESSLLCLAFQILAILFFVFKLLKKTNESRGSYNEVLAETATKPS